MWNTSIDDDDDDEKAPSQSWTAELGVRLRRFDTGQGPDLPP